MFTIKHFVANIYTECMDTEYTYAVKKERSCKSLHNRQVNAHSSTQRGFANQETPHTINYAETI